MATVTIRDLRNHGGDIVDRVLAGEHLVITRDGKPVADLRPLARQPLHSDALLERWRRLRPVDPAAVRDDVDAVVDPRL